MEICIIRTFTWSREYTIKIIKIASNWTLFNNKMEMKNKNLTENSP
jgi:hypothetical protein